MKRLPVDSTPVDFAFEIHTNVGQNCIGAKVNGKIVPLDTILHSGDQVEIITSKNQHPNKSWLQFVQTHKAKSNIRKYLNKEEDKLVETGRETWEKKAKKSKKQFNIDEMNRIAHKLRYDNPRQLFKDIATGKLDPEEIINPPREEQDDDSNELVFDSFVQQARRAGGGSIVVEGEHDGIQHSYAKCCNPIPGDPIIGFITTGEGIKIHRKDCVNVIQMSKTQSDKLVPVSWPKANGSMFVAGINIHGEDVPGILKDISNIITTYKNTNIKSVNISTGDSMFHGTIAVYVSDLEHLKKLMERLKKNRGIYSVERFDVSN
ncbi:MAG: ACT domain-containing protein [Melioribacteraceae bacterium]|nr:ACT domain-containing protein [Melioribacteraceae bacterium]